MRKVAELVEIDVAILSEMERGERKISKGVVQKLKTLYEYNLDELLVLLLSDKILHEIQDEDFRIEALKVAEERAKFIKASKKK